MLRSLRAWQVARVREAYTRVSGFKSDASGIDGMVEEMEYGLQRLDAASRERADDDVLRAIFLGAPGLSLLSWLHRAAPRYAPTLMARCAPFALRFLVGEVVVDGRARNRLPSCTFRERGGDALCERVCRRPTETFCGARGFAIAMEPEPGSLGCTWTWGGD